MVRLFDTYFPKRTLVLALSDICLVFITLIGATSFIRGSHPQQALGYEHGLLKVTIATIICLCCMYYSHLYDSRLISDPREVSGRLIQGLGITSIVLAASYLIFPATKVGGGFAIIGILMVGLSLVLSRHVFFALNGFDRLMEPTLIMGEGTLAGSLAQVIRTRPELGLRLVGYLGEPSSPVWQSHHVRCLGSVEELADVTERVEVRRIIVAMKDRRAKLPVEDLLRLKMAGIAIQEGDEFYEMATGKLAVDTVRLSWLIFSPGFGVSKLTLFYKRLFSVLLAGAAFILFLPLMAIIAVAIYIDSPGPVIFRQERIGMNGLPFTLYKFRTMFHEADRGGEPLPVQHQDPRITRLGRWLRQFRLDELPQLYNILLGQMSFVGPRPFVPNQEFELASQIPLYTQRWTVRPGATGWAQVQRGYCATFEDNLEKLGYDLFYIKNLSVKLDLLILFKTIKIVLQGIGGR